MHHNMDCRRPSLWLDDVLEILNVIFTLPELNRKFRKYLGRVSRTSRKTPNPALKAPIFKKRMVHLLNYTFSGKTVPQTMLVSVYEER